MSELSVFLIQLFAVIPIIYGKFKPTACADKIFKNIFLVKLRRAVKNLATSVSQECVRRSTPTVNGTALFLNAFVKRNSLRLIRLIADTLFQISKSKSVAIVLNATHFVSISTTMVSLTSVGVQKTRRAPKLKTRQGLNPLIGTVMNILFNLGFG